jgi:hypothetical protein
VQSWLVDLRRGQRALRRHRPLRALHYLERSLLNAPVTRRVGYAREPSPRADLARVFYYLAVSLRRAGMRNRAVGSLVESARLDKRGNARRKLARITNEYGMARQPTREQDDQQAFYGLQLARYIRSKRSHKLGTRAEIDMIAELIDEYWALVRETGALDGMGPDEKLRYFRETRIIFPYLTVPEETKTDDLAVDFSRGRRLEPGDRCACGSGLPFRLCHGRTPGTDEVLIGKF